MFERKDLVEKVFDILELKRSSQFKGSKRCTPIEWENEKLEIKKLTCSPLR